MVITVFISYVITLAAPPRSRPLDRCSARLCFQHLCLPFRPLPCLSWPTTCGNSTVLNDPNLFAQSTDEASTEDTSARVPCTRGVGSARASPVRVNHTTTTTTTATTTITTTTTTATTTTTTTTTYDYYLRLLPTTTITDSSSNNNDNSNSNINTHDNTYFEYHQ